MATAPSNRQPRAREFLQLHQPGQPLLMPNPWDATSARLLEAQGFRALGTSSAAAAWGYGRRDGSLGRELALDHAGRIAAAVNLPVSADLENGFGDAPECVAETLRLASEAGLAGGSIEDAAHAAPQPIYPFTLAVERIQAAVAAVRALPLPFVLTARAENFLHGKPDLEDTIARLAAFEAAGADVLFAPGLPSLEAVREVMRAVKKPVNFMVGPRQASFSVADLREAGVSRISFGTCLYRVAMSAVSQAATAIREEGRFPFLDAAISYADLESKGGLPNGHP